MTDYLPEAISNQHDDRALADAWHEIYGLQQAPSTWLGLNLQWPKFDLPKHQGLYVISWHTEYIDLEWLQNQSQRVYPDMVINITDYACDLSNIVPDNVQCLVYDSLAQQLITLVKKFGIAASTINQPPFKISSLSLRYSQYKKFVTAYLLNRADREQIVLSWWNHVAKPQDLHDHPAVYDHLDIDYSCLQDSLLINMPDESDRLGLDPVANGDWRSAAYQQALINLTNESFHYSFTTRFGRPFINPGPYLTEKTMKPLLAGRPFLAVGQCKTYDRLHSLGLRSDFGFDRSFDQDPGDLTRMGKIFHTIDQILSQDVAFWFDSSIDACRHNLAHISDGSMLDLSRHVNQATISALKNL